ncbi:YggS family pyridoxal phosphate enzyme [Actinobacillus delphinicola]|uniref:Pyridoxal phosphate homeostasis protein n=1 Tax=Actinobacillus delphinicola TaxID=51161 RepID=A0A448TUA3_9PAST|nr:YggS family pyridoxal phosphate-dependent enzyme [Actinobacillus delphinicola]MDG6897687.1 YggS family pyridoxal phosphate enzyme [Actinobacillus delphinicola]VEJ09569.1 alanine racemase domain-containing protein [Actinobacillus delphinicola]
MTIQQNLLKIRQEIKDYSSGKNVHLLAVSKFKPTSDIEAAYEAGQHAFGENYVQEGVEKIQYFRDKGIQLEWHFIGPLQSNKTRLVAENFDWCQTIDRLKIAQRLSEQRPMTQKPLNVLIQINISDEASKSGIKPQEMLNLAQEIVQLPNLCLRGLMAIPAATEDIDMQRTVFKKMEKLFAELKNSFPQQNIDTLSMGMSGDMKIAIECGSTMVRIGTAIFGAR